MLKGPKNALKVKLFFLNIFYIKIIVKIEKNIESYIKIFNLKKIVLIKKNNFMVIFRTT